MLQLLIVLIVACPFAIYWFVVRPSATSDAGTWPISVRFVPLLVATAILVLYFLTNSGAIALSRTEYMYGVFVLVLLPLSGVLLVLQFAIWYCIARRQDGRPQDPPQRST